MSSTQPKSRNITWEHGQVTRADRETRHGHKGVIVWLTGLSGSGKTTIAVQLENLLFEQGRLAYRLDGDNIRHGLNRDLGFSPEDRDENIRRIGEVAKLFAEAGVIVITSFISPYRKERGNVRVGVARPGDFVEVFVRCSVDECEKRDPKGLYAKARAGQIKEFTGISAPYEEPENPELVLDTDQEDVDTCVRRVWDYLKDNGYLNGR